VAGGKYEIGFEGSGFCYDNELSHHVVFLHEYEIGRSLVTNAEYLEFVNDGGYQNSNLWLDEGWSWVQENGIKGPKYWHKIDGEWHHFTLSGLKKLEGDHILCHVSYYEAAAFAEWKQMRLPTEFEWEAASSELEWGHRWE
jgi:formylglycine-generating enzyme required for sulfatase activity